MKSIIIWVLAVLVSVAAILFGIFIYPIRKEIGKNYLTQSKLVLGAAFGILNIEETEEKLVSLNLELDEQLAAWEV